MIDPDGIRQRDAALSSILDERGRRLLVAAEAKAAGSGGIAAVWRATGCARGALGGGLRELAEAPALTDGRVRRAGGGRKPAVESDPDLMRDLKALVEPTARGDPEGPLRWTCQSLRGVSDALQAQGHRISRTLVGELLHGLGFSLQANAKTHEGLSHPDRDAPFAFIDPKVKTARAAGEPVISVDAKKKELVGDFKNGGGAWRPKGSPEAVRVHDFLIKELGRAVPYGVYDLAANAGWVGVGQDHDTAAFAGQTIRRWGQEIGRPRYPGAKSLTITADGGGSNGVRVRLWKRELQRLADESGLAITVHHLPPGTSKWNAIEHRLFAFISQNWRATPLVSYRVIVDLIGATPTRTGLSVRCELDPNRYPKGVTVSDAEMAGLNIARDEGGFEICIEALPFWLMRIAREIGCGTSMQALRERRARQERADAHQAALLVQGLRPELHRHTHPRQAAGPEGGGRAAVCQRSLDEPHRQAAWRLNPHHPGLAGAVRGRLRPEARAGRTSGGDRAR